MGDRQKAKLNAACRMGASALLAGCVLAAALSSAAYAETLSGALAKAYVASPDINQQRAGVRANDENIPKAKSGYLPKVSGSASIGSQYSHSEAFSNVTQNNVLGANYKLHSNPRSFGVSAQQTLFDGFKTLNTVKQAESSIFGARETLRNTETTVLLNAATAYMNVLRDTAVLQLNLNNIKVLEEQVRQTKVRFQVGEVTRTDVAQSEAALAQGRSAYAAQQAALQASIASYRLYVGSEPKHLAPGKPIEALLPKQLETAVERSQVEHPAIASALHNADAAAYAVKIAESALYPTASVSAGLSKNYDVGGQPKTNAFTAQVLGNLNVPIYQGGAEYASIRQAKEQAAQARLAADLARDQVRSQVVTAWGQLQSSKAQIISGQAAVTAAEIALNGVREEAKVGQRTTYDVLVAQQALLNSRVTLVTAQRDRVVNSYAVLSAMGGLTAQRLALSTRAYDPTVHFEQVKNKLIGTSTPDGR
jgi:outer membrane protein